MTSMLYIQKKSNYIMLKKPSYQSSEDSMSGIKLLDGLIGIVYDWASRNCFGMIEVFEVLSFLGTGNPEHVFWCCKSNNTNYGKYGNYIIWFVF